MNLFLDFNTLYQYIDEHRAEINAGLVNMRLKESVTKLCIVTVYNTHIMVTL